MRPGLPSPGHLVLNRRTSAERSPSAHLRSPEGPASKTETCGLEFHSVRELEFDQLGRKAEIRQSGTRRLSATPSGCQLICHLSAMKVASGGARQGVWSPQFHTACRPA